MNNKELLLFGDSKGGASHTLTVAKSTSGDVTYYGYVSNNDALAISAMGTLTPSSVNGEEILGIYTMDGSKYGDNSLVYVRSNVFSSFVITRLDTGAQFQDSTWSTAGGNSWFTYLSNHPMFSADDVGKTIPLKIEAVS